MSEGKNIYGFFSHSAATLDGSVVPLRYRWSRVAYAANQLTFAREPDCRGTLPQITL